MLRVARAKLPSVRFQIGEFATFRLPKKAEAITCLFSAIGYLRTDAELLGAFRNFYANLVPEGVALIEPWITPQAYHGSRPHLVQYVSPDLVIARVNTTVRRGDVTSMALHHLIGTSKGVRHVVERHTMRMVPIHRLLVLLREAGFRPRFLRRGLPMGRGLLVARRPAAPRRAALEIVARSDPG